MIFTLRSQPGRSAACVAGWLRISGAGDESNRFLVKAAGWIALIAMALRIVFWIYTQRYWEDALITCLHAENMASGLGLTHVRPGEPPLHGFTSPLSVLVPLIGDLIHVGFGVEFLKLVSIPASALTVLYLLGISIHPKVRLSAPLAIVAMGYAAVEHHQILWGMAGMETQLAVLILVMSIYYTMTLDTVPLGLSLGLCMLVRPDYAFWTVISGVYVLFNRPRAFLQVAGIALAVYLPWIIFTTAYYGSPLPNTIIAKGLGYRKWYEKADEINLFTIKRHTWMMMAEQLHLHLAPVFSGHGASTHLFFVKGSDTPESPIANTMFGFAVLGTLVVAFKRQWALWPLVAVVVVYSLYYVYVVPVVFGWYQMPYIVTLLLLSLRGLQWVGEWVKDNAWRGRLVVAGMMIYIFYCVYVEFGWYKLLYVVPLLILIVFVVQWASSRAKDISWRGRLEGGFAAIYLGLFVSVLPICFYTERMIQIHVENAVRKPAGLYLKEHMKPDEAVACEPLGYISYYSRGNVYDWPGLASRTVVAWSKAQPPERRCLENMAHDLEPEYLFLRDLEVLYHFKSTEWLKQDYHVVKVFQVDPAIAPKIPWLDRNIDTSFRLYKKNHPDDAQPYDASSFPVK